jgi:hypothetical protein
MRIASTCSDSAAAPRRLGFLLTHLVHGTHCDGSLRGTRRSRGLFVRNPPLACLTVQYMSIMRNHKFNVGQTVNYTPNFIGIVNADAIFKITQLLRAEDDELQYRIRSVPNPSQ